MIATVAILAVALVASLVLNVACIVRIDSHRETDRLRVAAMRGMRARIKNQEALLDGTERAAEVAREVLRNAPLTDWERDLLLGDEPTPIYDETVDHEAEVLQFRKQIPNDLGGAS